MFRVWIQKIRQRLIRIFCFLFSTQKMVIIEKNVQDKLPCIKSPQVQVNLRTLLPHEFSEYKERFEMYNIETDSLFRDGNACIIGEINGKLIAWGFIAYNEANIMELERKIHIEPGSAYLYAGYTDKRYRSLGIGTKRLEKCLVYLRGTGITKAYALIHHNNLPSLRFTEKAGFRRIGTLLYFKFFGLKYYRYKSLNKEHHETLVKMFSRYQ